MGARRSRQPQVGEEGGEERARAGVDVRSGTGIETPAGNRRHLPFPWYTKQPPSREELRRVSAGVNLGFSVFAGCRGRGARRFVGSGAGRWRAPSGMTT